MRLKIVRIITVFLFIVLALDLIYIQAFQGRKYFGLSVNNRIRVIPLEGQRGRIFDRNGEVLVENRLSFNVTVIPQDVRNQEALFSFLSQVLNVDQKRLVARFQQKRHTPFAPVAVVEDIDQRTAMILEENKFRFPGLYIQENFRRWYPQGEVGAHVLGYVGKIDSAKVEKLKDYGYSQQSIVGYSGIEEYYDQYLKGVEGGVQIEVNSRGQQVRLLGIREPERGEDLQLTIDSRIQKAAYDALAGSHG
ncbi:MAG TPA: penicillin-binding protein 2, partial [Candidatus Omnitrophota bacterium]|nr:penicillin-binding protein 2 [Candidatus Omnitrophota bacterium]